jgi:hypothetical protein
MLANSAHLLGDAEEDPEGAHWLDHVLTLPRDAEVRRILASYHMRLVKRYAARQPRKATAHFARACKADAGIVTSFCGRLLMQYARRMCCV